MRMQMLNTKKVKEIQSKLSEEFKVSLSTTGKLQVYNLIEETYLTDSEIQLLLQDLTLNPEPEKLYLIQDQNGNYNGQIFLQKWDKSEPMKIEYLSDKKPSCGDGNIKQAKAKIQRLQELAQVLNLEGYSWTLIELTQPEWTQLYLSKKELSLNITNWDIPKGKIGTTKQAIAEVYKKYADLFKSIEKEWREAHV